MNINSCCCVLGVTYAPYTCIWIYMVIITYTHVHVCICGVRSRVHITITYDGHDLRQWITLKGLPLHVWLKYSKNTTQTQVLTDKCLNPWPPNRGSRPTFHVTETTTRPPVTSFVFMAITCFDFFSYLFIYLFILKQNVWWEWLYNKTAIGNNALIQI